MLETFFFVLGLVNAIMLITIFLIRRKRLDLIQRFGWIYLILAVPAVYGIFLSVQEQKPAYFSIFLVIFLAFLMMEWLLDFIFKINFREDWRKNWNWLLPYLVLYYSMNYGFVRVPWMTSLKWGVIMLSLFVVQIITNIQSHPKAKHKN